MQLIESTFRDLYRSTVAAFPRTTKRQHAIDPISISGVTMTPYIGMKTLYIRCLAQNENREYTPRILAKGVKYHEGAKNKVTINGRDYYFEEISLVSNDLLIRCDCKDFYWRFHHYDWVDKSLSGPNRKKYESQGGSPANPLEKPGMCKHLIKMFKVLAESNIFSFQE